MLALLIADIRGQRHSMSDTRVVVFHNSYETGTEKKPLLRQFPSMTHCARASFANRSNRNPVIGSAREDFSEMCRCC